MGIGTTNVSAVDSNNTAVLAVGIVTAHKLYGDGSNITGVGGVNHASSVICHPPNMLVVAILFTGNFSSIRPLDVPTANGPAQ